MSAELRDAPAAARDEELADFLVAARRAGLFAMTVPRRAGGVGAGLRAQVRVIAELGQECPSTAWIAALSAALKSVCSPLFPEEAREVLFADPDAIVCGSTTPLGARSEQTGYGFSISGRWQAAAGCEHSAWAVLAAPVHVKGQLIVPCPVLVSTRDLTVERTGPTTGMAGTGTHTLVAQDVVVPTAHVVLPRTEADGEPDAPVASTALLGMVVVMLAPLLGAARGARRAMEAGPAGGKSSSAAAGRRPAGSPLPRERLTAADRLVDSATRRTLRVAGVLDALGTSASLPSQEQTLLRAELLAVAQECREAVEPLLDLHSAGGFAPDLLLRRFRNDVAVITRHPQFDPHTVAEDYGRVLFGPGPGAVPML
ncbi:acyl-CoA dehydrogenase family protein [Streptomyces sp. NPDC047082]|uniref:acyl-CoA dehydrogenase family protein n=1 Tax=Streptomyces sp. NPDC047082 TaxID=3155259 RepID=UPI0033C977E1